MKRSRVAPTTDEDDVPLSEVTSADVERMDGVLGPANDIPFLLMRSERPVAETDLLDVFLRTKHELQLARSAAASGSKKQRAGSKHKLMVDGEVKYPINDCSDVKDAWGLRGHATGVSQDKVESYIKGAAKAEGCPIPGQEDKQVKRAAPGDPEWEATDASLGQQAILLMQQAAAILANAKQREQLEELFAGYPETGDIDRLADALASLGSAVACVADFVDGETSEAQEESDTDEGSEGDGYARVGKTISAATGVKIQAALEALTSLVGDTGAPANTPEGVQMKDGKEMQAKKDGDEEEEEEEQVEREQAGKIGTRNKPAMAGSQPGATAPADLGNVKSDEDLVAKMTDGEGNMKAAVAKTAANVHLATSEEESPEIGEVIARAIASSFAPALKSALEDALKPVKESLERIAAEDSKAQARPFLRGAGGPDYHLVQRGDGSVSVTSDSEQLQRALEQLDPTSRDVVTRQLALAQHPLIQKQQQ